MKKLSIFSAVILSLAVSGLTQAQQSASGIGSASAEIQSEAISIEETQPLDFGRISPFSVDGSITIIPNNNSRDVSNVIHTEIGNRGEWLVTGFPRASFAITITDEFFLTSDDGQNTMLVDRVNVGLPGGTIRQNNGITSSSLNENGLRELAVGGRINIGADQASGIYNGQYQITVVYN